MTNYFNEQLSIYLAITCACDNINCIYLIFFKFSIVNSGLRTSHTKDYFVSINHKLFKLMTEHPLHNFAIICSSYLLNSLCNILVLSPERT